MSNISRRVPAEAKKGGFTVELARSGEEYFIPEGETILNVLLDAGIDIDYSCELGICGACEQRVISGIPEHRDSILSEEEQAENKRVMICCAGCKTRAAGAGYVERGAVALNKPRLSHRSFDDLIDAHANRQWHFDPVGGCRFRFTAAILVGNCTGRSPGAYLEETVDVKGGLAELRFEIDVRSSTLRSDKQRRGADGRELMAPYRATIISLCTTVKVSVGSIRPLFGWCDRVSSAFSMSVRCAPAPPSLPRRRGSRGLDQRRITKLRRCIGIDITAARVRRPSSSKGRPLAAGRELER